MLGAESMRPIIHGELSCLPEIALQASFASLLSDGMFDEDPRILIMSSKTDAICTFFFGWI